MSSLQLFCWGGKYCEVMNNELIMEIEEGGQLPNNCSLQLTRVSHNNLHTGLQLYRPKQPHLL